MTFQEIIILTLFTGAITYLGSVFYKNFFSAKNSCGGNCGCSAVDVQKLEKEIEKKMAEKFPAKN